MALEGTLMFLVAAVCNQVDYANVTRLNHTKSMMLVNSQFPGPPITAHEGDTIVVRVTSLVQPNITIHW
jgi:laccase